MTLLRLTQTGATVPQDAPRRDTRRRHADPRRAFRNSYRWQQFSKRIIERDEVCQVCGHGPRPDDPLTAGHIVAVRNGGAIYDEANAQAEHRSCNSRRGTRR